MFTGIIEQLGRITHTTEQGGHLTVSIAPAQMWRDLQLGESVACGGTCLTVTGWDDQSFWVDLSLETLAKTAPNWQLDQQINLERAMTAQQRFGGHIVSGHVDGVGQVLDVTSEPGAYTIRVRAPQTLARYLTPKGSITADGVSLTVVEVGGPAGSRPEWPAEEFTLWLVPHTLQVTALGRWRPGSQVNLEADQVAKYVERLLAVRGPGAEA